MLFRLLLLLDQAILNSFQLISDKINYWVGVPAYQVAKLFFILTGVDVVFSGFWDIYWLHNGTAYFTLFARFAVYSYSWNRNKYLYRPGQSDSALGNPLTHSFSIARVPLLGICILSIPRPTPQPLHTTYHDLLGYFFFLFIFLDICFLSVDSKPPRKGKIKELLSFRLSRVSIQ